MELRPYYRIKNELTFKADLILKGERLIIPKILQNRILSLVHETHMGIVKTKSLLREKCWWPGMDSDVEELINNCIPCLSMGSTTKEPMGHIDYPISNPWEQVHVDFAGPYPSGDYVFGIIDSSTRWPELYVTRSTTSETIIKYLDHSFACHGYPVRMVTDNAPNLISAQVTEYCQENNIKHKKATPYHPQSNSEIERFYRTLGKFIKTTHSEGRSWKKELNKFLLMYRNTPHCSTNISPAKLLMGRKLRDKIPCLPERNSEVMVEARKISDKKKIKSKEYYDKKKNVKNIRFECGEYVLIREQKKGKYTTKYETTPVKIVKVIGSAVTVLRNGREVIRDVSDVKKIGDKLNLELESKDMQESNNDWEWKTEDEETYNKERFDEVRIGNNIEIRQESESSEDLEENAIERNDEAKQNEVRRSGRKRKPPERMKLYVQ